ncbi:MAG: type II secretion system F family protein [Candidatus Omnitrophica bacterium]|nr:type II secretion system F family protein [Candidatus Omnitrophota bacterium]
MEKFKYDARDKAGNSVSGIEQAANRNQVLSKLRQAGLFPINIAEVSSQNIKIKKNKLRFNDNERVFFTRQFSNLLDSGMPLAQALNLLTNQTNNPKIKAVCSKLYSKISEGGYLWEALSKYPDIFSRAYVGMVRAAEMGGDIESVFNNLADFNERGKEVKDSVISMLIYPVIIFFVGIATVIFLMVFIIPKMVFMFKESDTALPLITKLLINSSLFLSDYWLVLIVVGVIAVFGLKKIYSRTKNQLFFDRCLYKLPLLGDILKKIAFSRFCYIVSLLTANGMSILDCLEISREVLPHKMLRDAVDEIIAKIRSGGSFSASMKQQEIFPIVMVDMIAVGEQTGRLEKTLRKVADSFDKQIKEDLRRLLNVLEPAIILLIAAIVGGLVAAVLLPIFQLNMQTF